MSESTGISGKTPPTEAATGAATESTSGNTGTATAPESWSRRTWHRRASRPVTYWLVALIIAGLIPPVLPEYRWVLIHLFTLGAVTNSIVVWSQYFTERFLHQPLPDGRRPAQLAKIRVLNSGIIITVIGQLLAEVWAQHWIITAAGSTVVGSALFWHALSLAGQFRSAERGRRYAPSVIAYVLSALFLPFGALAGGLLAWELPGAWQERVLLAHTVINLLGFLGFAALGSLAVLYPAVWRTRLPADATRWALILLGVGMVPVLAGVLGDNGYLTAGGLILYTLGWLVCTVSWLRASFGVLAEPRDRVTFASASVAAAPLWLLGCLTSLIIDALRYHGELHQITPPTIALLVGFGAQLLIGVMSHLLPSTIGGGPAAVRTGLYTVGRAGLFRWTLLNGGLAVWLVTENSWLRVIASLLSIGALVAFIPLLAAAVRAQRGVLMKRREPLEPLEEPRYGQVTAGIAVLALLLGAFGGLNPGAAGNQAVTAPPAATSEGDTYQVHIDAGDMVFNPDLIEVPAGMTLEVVFRNTDTMVHDLKFANGVQSGRVLPGEEVTFTVGRVTAELEGWCTIAGHRAQGMDLLVVPGSPPDP